MILTLLVTIQFKLCYCVVLFALSHFSALMLLVLQKEHPACKNWMVRYWRG